MQVNMIGIYRMIRRRKVSCKVDVNYLSECCDAPPSGEVDETIHGIIGFCGRCKDNTVFYIESDDI